MRILALTRYGRKGPSSRQRFLQYLPALEAHGIHVDVSPVLNDEYIDASFADRSIWQLLIAGYLSRVAALYKASQYDLIWLEKELLTWVPLFFERWLFPSKVPVVIDYDDAVFHRYDQSRNSFIRMTLSSKHAWLARHATTIVAGNDYLATTARSFGARQVEILPTVVDIARYPVRQQPDGVFTVGWIGSPATGVYLNIVHDALRELARRASLRFLCVGHPGTTIKGVHCESKAWSEETESLDIADFHVGIMPLHDTPWEKGKCGYKLVQYLASGVPAVASPVGANCSIIEQGSNGFLADGTTQWIDALDRLRTDGVLRAQMGDRGRCTVAERFSLTHAAPRLISILQKAAGE